MLPKNQRLISGWGLFPKVKCTLYRPEKMSELGAAMQACHAGMIAQGAGRSYGDAALNMSGTILTERLSRFLALDAKKGTVRAEAGVTLAEVMQVCVPKGWFPPVIPGTKFVSLGGCLAANVHGKNAYAEGEFARHVESVSLRLPSGKLVEATPEGTPDLFWATAGGMGMTGIIEEVTLRLRPIVSTQLAVEKMRVENLEEMLLHFRQYHKKQAQYMVGWIDHFGKDANLGRGVFEAAWHGEEAKPESLAGFRVKGPEFDVPCHLPRFVLNKYMMAYYNRLRFTGVPKEAKRATAEFDGFFHPLDAIGLWNRLYGRQGLLQYQCLVPEGRRHLSHLRQVLSLIQESGQFSSLAVIKYHGKREGMMSFSDQGYSLALDFHNTPKVQALLTRLDAFIAGIGGRVYLAKDARLAPETFERMYAAALPRWRKVLKEVDPKRKMQSAMAERLGFRSDK